ncbi:MAG: hypothetical protein AMXMBFR33_71510 [Candidatus Xenobia bacterium]
MRAFLLGWLLLARLAAQEGTFYENWNLEQNRRWIASRSSQPEASVGVFADYGVWNLGARSLVQALEESQLPCRVFDRSGLTRDKLSGLKVLILPGGLAPLQYQAAGKQGLEAVEQFVRSGGRVLAICAGAYLVSREVRYEGKSYPYPVGLFDGVAEGPVAGLAVYPKAGPARLSLTEEGRERGLGPIDGKSALYGSGPRFVGGSQVTVLARYHDQSAAVVCRPLGKGEVVLSGVHFERPLEGKDSDPPPPEAASTLRALIRL